MTSTETNTDKYVQFCTVLITTKVGIYVGELTSWKTAGY